MSNYGLVYRDEQTGCIMLGEFNADKIIEDFYEIKDPKYGNLPGTMFSVVDVQHEGDRVALLDLNQFEMFQQDGTADPAAMVISLLFGMEDRGAALFERMFDDITEDMFSGTKQ